MSEHVEIVEESNETVVVVKLDRGYGISPRSKILKDAVRKLQKEITEQVYRER